MVAEAAVVAEEAVVAEAAVVAAIMSQSVMGLFLSLQARRQMISMLLQ